MLFRSVNDTCTRVGSVDHQTMDKVEDTEEVDVPESKRSSEKKDCLKAGVGENSNAVLPFRKRVSLTKMSDTSIWITGPSGSIYERFWNGLQWVIAPHDLPASAGYAISVFIVNQIILALSEAGNLYQVLISEGKHVYIIQICSPNRNKYESLLHRCHERCPKMEQEQIKEKNNNRMSATHNLLQKF